MTSNPNLNEWDHLYHSKHAKHSTRPEGDTVHAKNWRASVAQDMLCILSLWFKYGHLSDLHAALSVGMATIHLDNWLGVLPQLIARLNNPEPNARGLLHDLLRRIGLKHAQALMYSLTVALKSSSEERRQAALEIMTNMKANNPKLIEQASLVAHELVRVAILWQEK